MENTRTPRKLWEHGDPARTEMFTFMKSISPEFKTFRDVHDFSVQYRSDFYHRLFQWAGLIHEGSYDTVVDESAPIESVPIWFSGVQLNWAENILYSRNSSNVKDYQGKVGKEDDKIAVSQIREGNTEIRHVSWAQLRRDAGRLASALKRRGLREGDRVIIVAANSVDTLLVFLATTWLGAIFSSVSTEMGVSGILQRATQINPKFIFFDDASFYNGKTIDLRQKITDVMKGMETCGELRGAFAIPRFKQPFDISSMNGIETFSSLFCSGDTNAPQFVRIPFHSPFLICYSSGTTGKPKAIVHSVGGVLLNLHKEDRLHECTDSESAVLQFTTTSWIMYLLQIGALLSGARVILYDGSPLMPDVTTFIKIIEEQQVTKFGTSPRWMLEIMKKGISPRDTRDMSSLKVVTSTGMTLPDEMFEWFYDVAFPPKVHLINMSGGTDIAGCFAVGNPLTPVYVGGTQGPSLGLPVTVYDSQHSKENGAPVESGTAGELVVTAAFPNMPCFFWGDTSSAAAAPPGSKYHSSYFNRFEHVWTHGDFCTINPDTSNIHFLGRSDGVLNPSGVRFGSSEIYAIIESKFSTEVSDSLCVGQRRPGDADESVMLFLLMAKGHKLTKRLIEQIQVAIANELSKRHVPKYIFETPEIPVTVNLKKVEISVKQIVSGQIVKPSGTLMNPECLGFYYQFARVEELDKPLAKL